MEERTSLSKNWHRNLAIELICSHWEKYVIQSCDFWGHFVTKYLRLQECLADATHKLNMRMNHENTQTTINLACIVAPNKIHEPLHRTSLWQIQWRELFRSNLWRIDVNSRLKNSPMNRQPILTDKNFLVSANAQSN